jgi:hypothetical protein
LPPFLVCPKGFKPPFWGRADSLKEGKELREVMFELARGFGE